MLHESVAWRCTEPGWVGLVPCGTDIQCGQLANGWSGGIRMAPPARSGVVGGLGSARTLDLNPTGGALARQTQLSWVS